MKLIKSVQLYFCIQDVHMYVYLLKNILLLRQIFNPCINEYTYDINDIHGYILSL